MISPVLGKLQPLCNRVGVPRLPSTQEAVGHKNGRGHRKLLEEAGLFDHGNNLLLVEPHCPNGGQLVPGHALGRKNDPGQFDHKGPGNLRANETALQ